MTDVAMPTEQQARALTDRIRIAVEGTWLLIQEAYTSRAWAALGYETWDTYCAAEFGTARLDCRARTGKKSSHRCETAGSAPAQSPRRPASRRAQ